MSRRTRSVAILLAGAVALSVLVMGQLVPQWRQYRATVLPAQTVARGQTAVVSGQRWTVADVRTTGTDGGLTELQAVLDRTGPQDGRSCAGVLTDGTRRWAASLGSGTMTTSCDLPGPVRLSFHLPAGAFPTAVDITATDGAIMLRLLL